MKSNNQLIWICFVLLLVIPYSRSNAQSNFKFTYDDNGNQKERTLKVEQTSMVSFPTSEKLLKPLNNGSNNMMALEESSDAQKEIKIFPNPTRGLIRISLINYSDQLKGTCMIFGLNGHKLKDMRIDSQDSEIDIQDLPDGLYVLRLTINGLISDYKVIKKN